MPLEREPWGFGAFVDALLNERIPIVWGEIVLAAGTAVLLGVVISVGLNHKLLHRAAKKLRITRRWGRLDVWGKLFDSPHTNWVIARDLEHGFTYFGWLEAFSETSAHAEVLLSDVAVVESATGTKRYDSRMLDFAQDVRALSIEILSPAPDAGVRDGRPEFPPIRDLRRGDVQPGRDQSQSEDAPAEHRDRAAGSERAAPAPHQRKRKGRGQDRR